MAKFIDENQARRTIEKWRASGLGVVQFAKCEGISVRMFYRMRAKADTPAVADHCIVPVVVRSGSAPAIAAPGSPFEIELASGMKIRVAAGFDVAELLRLVGALAGVRC